MAELYDHIGRQALPHHGVALLHSVTTLQQDSRKARLCERITQLDFEVANIIFRFAVL